MQVFFFVEVKLIDLMNLAKSIVKLINVFPFLVICVDTCYLIFNLFNILLTLSKKRSGFLFDNCENDKKSSLIASS